MDAGGQAQGKAIVFLCRALERFGIGGVQAEDFRLAKLDDGAAVDTMWRVLHGLCLLRVSGFRRSPAESPTRSAFAGVGRAWTRLRPPLADAGADIRCECVRRLLAGWGYAAARRWHPRAESSRALLLAVGWMLLQPQCALLDMFAVLVSDDISSSLLLPPFQRDTLWLYAAGKPAAAAAARRSLRRSLAAIPRNDALRAVTHQVRLLQGAIHHTMGRIGRLQRSRALLTARLADAQVRLGRGKPLSAYELHTVRHPALLDFHMRAMDRWLEDAALCKEAPRLAARWWRWLSSVVALARQQDFDDDSEDDDDSAAEAEGLSGDEGGDGGERGSLSELQPASAAAASFASGSPLAETLRTFALPVGVVSPQCSLAVHPEEHQLDVDGAALRLRSAVDREEAMLDHYASTCRLLQQINITD